MIVGLLRYKHSSILRSWQPFEDTLSPFTQKIFDKYISPHISNHHSHFTHTGTAKDQRISSCSVCSLILGAQVCSEAAFLSMSLLISLSSPPFCLSSWQENQRLSQFFTQFPPLLRYQLYFFFFLFSEIIRVMLADFNISNVHVIILDEKTWQWPHLQRHQIVCDLRLFETILL